MAQVKTGSGNTNIPQVSVIVPCYNHGQYLSEALQSVAAQTYSDWECVVIDNGSTDNTKQVAEGFASRDQRFSYRYIEQQGVSAARNRGVQQSSGRYILPLDADDRIGTTYLEKAVAVLEKNVSIKVVYCDAQLFGASRGKWKLPPFNFRELLIENLIFSSGLFRREDFDPAGGYNENMKEGFEDWDFWIGLLKRGGEVYKIPQTLFYYRIRSSSRNNSLSPEKQLALRKQVFENHKDVYLTHFDLPGLLFAYYNQQVQLRQLRRSGSYRLGAMVLSPIYFIKKLLGRKKG